ncbi:LOW QUALITY PROTEIN: dynein heavy chain 6, axonemal-like [Melanaphis sacchari]|uniref:LOW QUALITY PROTEIN: dynein heavy chain 6, axonemal-like n=1 Tax=Melanaphis sacchari TaxID=742174 RepID=UPI000DC15A0D|nr:LOW QUALITY PROTEIN: dynein heavy chain 6, axonemal-like [Melanaphis sacchari]
MTKFDILTETSEAVRLRILLRDSIVEWEKKMSAWETDNFHNLDVEQMNMFLALNLKYIVQFTKNIPECELINFINEKVQSFKTKMSIIAMLRNPNLKNHHWIKIEQILGTKFPTNQTLTLKILEELNVFSYGTEIMEVSGQASSEATLEAILKKIEDSWKIVDLIVLPYKNTHDIFILGSLEEVQLTLEEANINLNTLISSKHVVMIRSRVEEWINSMNIMNDVLNEWIMCQNNWIYLESIFSAPDIQRQLPNEAALFSQVNSSWKAIMLKAEKNPLAISICTDTDLLKTLIKNNQQLEQIMLYLEAYLESKRVVFPRFYFLSNDELIEIIAQARNTRAVQPHMNKCFDAIWRIQFKNDDKEGKPLTPDKEGSSPTNIIAMISPEREIVKFSSQVKAAGNVEFWLTRVEKEMVNTLRMFMFVAMEDYDRIPREKWVLSHAAQLIIAVSQMMWCRDVHKILKLKSNIQEKLVKFEQKCFKDLNNLAAMVRGYLTTLQRSVICALITIDVHARDIISTMVVHKINSDLNFEWLKQFRYYWDTVDSCVAYMANARWLYAFEYLGASPRLVITPLTDKCYLCLMGALQLNLGGAPAGPAGTGKTETTKDLAKALATQCVVFNCSDGLDYKMMGKFFSGLAQSGAWCCFDEFNRIEIEVLSVIAQQLITIMNAKLINATKFMFEGREIRLIKTCAAFITMNPGYAGRSELPDNLQALFRPMAMMVPDYGLIAEVILYSEGFESSKMLSQKMVKMYKLCSEQLSIQDHYDFGMRAVKSVLVMAGSLKRQNPFINENLVLIRALRDSNLPKFLKDDAILFQGILNDLFPGIVLPEQDYGMFLSTAKNVMENNGYQIEECIYVKVIQLLETIIVRHGIMTVGSTGGGKTTVLKILSKTLTELYNNKIEEQYYRPVKIYQLNPKAITMSELYGEVNLLTMEWRDGLLGKFIRQTVQTTKEIFQWVVCDGPVDAIWIENLNTVLDDNKLLCLANSERIKLSSWVRMIFEVGDLSQASPATVSRCGMVYVDATELGWLPYVNSWINRLRNDAIQNNIEIKKYLLTLFETYVYEGFSFIDKHCLAPIKQVEISKVTMMCSIIESLLSDSDNFNIETETEKFKIQNYILQSFIFSYLWSLGSNLVDSSQNKFENLVFNQFENHSEFLISPGMKLFDVYLNTVNNTLENWDSIVPKFVYNANTPYFELLVPTVDSIRYAYVMQRLVQMNQPVMLTGTTGVGKTSVANLVMQNLATTDNWITGIINFSAQTSSFRTQQILESKLIKKKRNRFGAPGNKRLAIFIDDVNMPKPEIYGAQPPIELLRQLLDSGGIYDRDKLDWKYIENVILCTICAPPGGGRNPLTPRFTRHFSMLFIPTTSENAMRTIFTSILDGFFEEFPPIIANSCPEIVEASIEVYSRISDDLLPTPAKSHYVFNLRDLSKTIQGVLQADFATIPDRTHLFRLWYHETLRVYHDRLVCQEDRSYFYNLLQKVCINYFDKNVLEFSKSDINLTQPPMLIFGDFMNSNTKENRIYEEITDIIKLKKALTENLMDFNMIYNKDMKIIFFMDAIEHISRIARILRSERGNALLVGVSGMGKQSLTKLASHLNDYKCFQIELTKSYDYTTFHEDLVNLYYLAGAKFEDTTFLFTDNQIVQEVFLEDINNILNSGEVPNLFKHDDLEKVIIACRLSATESGISSENREAIYRYFIQRVRSKLHLVICMSPIGDAFRRRCRLFPSLVNNSTIDWFDDWPKEALLSVAYNSLGKFSQSGNLNLIGNLTNICNSMHESVSEATKKFYDQMRRYYYVTPKSYLDFLKLYLRMHEFQTNKIKSESDRISKGLGKLYETFNMVGQMKIKLKAMEPELFEKNEATLKLMNNLTIEKAGVDTIREVVLLEESAVKIKADAAQAIAEDAQKDLALAMPEMKAAKAALESLNKKDINELRVFNKPPKLVQTVMEAVCLLLKKKTDWASAKLVLGDSNFLKTLQEYDTDNISDKMINQLKPYIDNPDFNEKKVAVQSSVARSMCKWVRAVYSYYLIFKIVEPKRKKQQEAEDELNIVLTELKAKQKMLSDVQARLKKLEDTYDQSVSEKNKLELNIGKTQSRLNRSDLLVEALSDEQLRWENNIQILAQRLLTVTGDTIIAAGCVNYLGPFTDEYRKDITHSWLRQLTLYEIQHSTNYSLSSVLIDSFELRSWNMCGLPRDLVSTDSAIIVTRASRWPLMIDPQEQANKWIKALEMDNSLRTCKGTDSDIMNAIIDAIRLGYTVLIEGLEENIDPTLRPILENITFRRGGRLLMRIGNTDIEYDEQFRFYMTTKMSNPHYLPDICIQVTLVNFTVTLSGLEDQLLVDVVRLEMPDLEEKRTETIVNINDDNNLLKEMEDKTLRMLNMSKGNILDDEELIQTLNNSKETSIIIAGRLIDAEETEQNISIARERYRAVANRGSCLYFVVAQLSEIDTMYQFSLNYFSSIFCNVIKNSDKKIRIDVKMPTMIEDITKAVYTTVSRGLFERHKLIFSFLVSVSINLQAGKITNTQWNFLLRGPIGKLKRKMTIKPAVFALTEDMWKSVNYMSEVFSIFKHLPENCTRPIKITLGNFIQDIHLDHENNDIEINWNSKLNSFEKLMIIKAFKEEKLIFAITNYVSTELGKAFIESPGVSLHLLYNDTSSTIPLIFILSPGSDPFVAFQKFAMEFGMIDKLRAISLGQGQGPIAEKLIKNGQREGHWIFLQNCHLASSWMLHMENLVQNLIENPLNINSEFRLFLSSMPSKSFPTFVLQNALKVTNEPPKGLRANMKRSFTDINIDFFENNAFSSDWRKMVFGLCFFHAIILERKKFGSLGWNIAYSFTDSDRECAMLLLHMYCLNAKEIPWDALQYITGEINYGGRVTDSWDQITLKTVLLNFFGPHTLEPDYKYSESGIYFCPETVKCTTINDYQLFIDKLPIVEEPEIFGMHENANIAYQTKETQETLMTIIEAYPKSLTGTVGKSDDEIVMEMAIDISEKLVNLIDFGEAHSTIMNTDDKGRLPSLSTVLSQEIERFNKLLDIIQNSLNDLRKAIKGLVVMSAELEGVYISFMSNMVPNMWLNKAYPSLKALGSWVKDLALRLDFIYIWMKFGSPPSYWISGLYFPQGFMTGCLQRHARKYAIPIDSLKVDFELTRTILVQEEIAAVHAATAKEDNEAYKGLKKLDDGVYVHGLYLDAGRIDSTTSRLVDPIPGDLYPSLPVIRLVPTTNLDEHSLRYNCPLYKTAARAGVLSTTGHSTNFVIAVLLPTDFPESYWILKGTALITQLTN